MKKLIVCLIVVTSVFYQLNTYAKGRFHDQPSVSYINYPSENLEVVGELLTISGKLTVPSDASADAKVPAVLILHGSAGVDSRGSFYGSALNRAGIATLEIDMWAARNLTGGANRPALPTLTMPDAFNGLNYLANHPFIDAEKIGVIGFSWGAVITMLASTETYVQQFGKGHQFAGHIAHYPICWAYNIGLPGINFSNLTSAPLLIQIGELDDYDEGSQPCENLIASLPTDTQERVSLNVYKNAHHAWDRIQPAMVVNDPFSHLGQGGEVDIAPNVGKAYQSRQKALHFFKQLFNQ